MRCIENGYRDMLEKGMQAIRLYERCSFTKAEQHRTANFPPILAREAATSCPMRLDKLESRRNQRPIAS